MTHSYADIIVSPQLGSLDHIDSVTDPDIVSVEYRSPQEYSIDLIQTQYAFVTVTVTVHFRRLGRDVRREHSTSSASKTMYFVSLWTHASILEEK